MSEVYVGNGLCQDSSSRNFKSAFYSSINTLNACAVRCENYPTSLGYTYEPGSGWCFCHFDGSGTIPNDYESFLDGSGVGPISTVFAQDFRVCYKFVDTLQPTISPTPLPSVSPTGSPTSSPSVSPTRSPSVPPTNIPSRSPLPFGQTHSPTGAPTSSPSGSPSVSPTNSPSRSPLPFGQTHSPTGSPSAAPTTAPTGGLDCGPGTHMDLVNWQCVDCNAGSASNTHNATSCSLCSAGSYAGSTGSTTCTLCFFGYYQPFIGSFSCSQCPPRRTTQSLGSKVCDRVISSG